MSPDGVVIGIQCDYGRELMERLYRAFLLNNFRVMFMDLPSDEMTQYAPDPLLAPRISFICQIAHLCKRVRADVHCLRTALRADARISGEFLYPGCGYGGSCFPKDVRALIRTGEEHGCHMQILRAVDQVNERHSVLLFDKLIRLFCSHVACKHVAIC